MPDTALQELERDASSRKRFLKMVGGAGGAGALSILIAACGGGSKTTSSTSAGTAAATADTGMTGDLKILNYALTLEYLEAAFYQQAAASGQIKDKAVLAIAKKFGDTEQQHVDALTGTIKRLGGTPAAEPKTAFDAVINGGEKKILATAAAVENLGAAAYLGQAANIKNKDVLAAALSIHSVEARHAAALNQLIGKGFKGSLPDGAFAVGMSMAQVLPVVKPFIAS
jgi:rubrerythrin